MLYDGRDIGGFLEVTLVWIHHIHQNLRRTQWPRVGNNIDSALSHYSKTVSSQVIFLPSLAGSSADATGVLRSSSMADITSSKKKTSLFKFLIHDEE